MNASVDVHDEDATMFHLWANTDPGRDLHRRGHRLGFDATGKLPGDARHGQPVRPFPPFQAMSPEITDRVTARAAEFGLD